MCPGRIAQLFPKVNSPTLTLVQVPMNDVETSSPEQGLYCLPTSSWSDIEICLRTSSHMATP